MKLGALATVALALCGSARAWQGEYPTPFFRSSDNSDTSAPGFFYDGPQMSFAIPYDAATCSDVHWVTETYAPEITFTETAWTTVTVRVPPPSRVIRQATTVASSSTTSPVPVTTTTTMSTTTVVRTTTEVATKTVEETSTVATETTTETMTETEVEMRTVTQTSYVEVTEDATVTETVIVRATSTN